jgi:hypothetical protein
VRGPLVRSAGVPFRPAAAQPAAGGRDPVLRPGVEQAS